MPAPDSDPRSPCPVVFALDTFGDRWTLLIVRDMVLRGFRSYGEFLNAGEGISTNVLADRLKRLEAGGVVTKRPDPDHGAKYLYALSEKGLDLIPVLVEMMRWSLRHDPDTGTPEALREALAGDPAALSAHLRERARGVDA